MPIMFDGLGKGGMIAGLCRFVLSITYGIRRLGFIVSGGGVSKPFTA
jgi:hypothetical protein